MSDPTRMPPWPRIARAIVRIVFRALFRPRVVGTPPRRGPYILVANHQGWADAFLLIAEFPAEPRVCFFADREGATGVWWKRVFVRSLGGIVIVDRSVAVDRSAIDVSLRLLERGAVLGVFPEGRVSHRECDLTSFQRGVAYLALRARVPVLPVWLRGTAELYLGRELVATVGALRHPPAVTPTKEETAKFASVLHDDLATLAEPWVEPAGVHKHWRWLTNIL